MALPRSTTLVPGGISSRMARQNSLRHASLPPKASRWRSRAFPVQVSPPWTASFCAACDGVSIA
jgi:hypothetical protein